MPNVGLNECFLLHKKCIENYGDLKIKILAIRVLLKFTFQKLCKIYLILRQPVYLQWNIIKVFWYKYFVFTRMFNGNRNLDINCSTFAN